MERITAYTHVKTCHFSNKNISQTGIWLRFAGYAPKGIMQMIRRIINWVIDRMFKDEKDWDQ